jgi:integrase
MKVKHIKNNGRKVWMVDGTIDGKRKRLEFDTQRQAKDWLKFHKSDTTGSAWWAELNPGLRVDVMAAVNRAQADGFSLLSAVEGHAVNGRGKTHLKKMTLKEAVGSVGKDRRWKNDPNGDKPSGFLGDKVLANIGKGSLTTLRCGLENFMRFGGPDLQCNAVSPELIKSWLVSGGDKERHWEPCTRKHYSGHVRNLFNWLIRQDVVTENPVLKLEKINLEPFDPYVLTIKECRKVLNLCREKHSEVLPLLTLNLFCGIRPSETRRLKSGKGRGCNFDWEENEVVFQAKKTKTKMRRFVEMSDNCLAWLNLQELNLPIANANHKWDRFLQDAKKALEYDVWPHDCIRHSFCSYGLRHTENAAKVALQAGNTERVLFRHYLKLVSKSDAAKFWNIMPQGSENQIRAVA